MKIYLNSVHSKKTSTHSLTTYSNLSKPTYLIKLTPELRHTKICVTINSNKSRKMKDSKEKKLKEKCKRRSKKKLKNRGRRR